jgi:hypothetical protein
MMMISNDYCYYKFRLAIKGNWWRFPRQWPAGRVPVAESGRPERRRLIHGNGRGR